MAIEYRLSHTASEIDKKLTAVGEIENSLKSNYYTSANVDTKIEEVNTSIGEVNTALEEINTSLEEVNTSLTTKADLVDGKIPASQLPDDIGGGAPAEHTHDISDIDGLLTEETFTKMDTLWEYSDGMVADAVIEVLNIQLYHFSDDTELNSFIGIMVTDTDGNEIETTSEMVDSSSGILHAINLPTCGCCMAIFPADFDLSLVGASGIVSAGTYATRYIDTVGGAAKIQAEVEETKLSISNELFPSALQIGEVGFKIEWDGTPTEEYIDDLAPILGATFYKVSESLTKEELIGSTVYMLLAGETITCPVTNNEIFDTGDKSFIIMDSNGQIYAAVTSESTTIDLSFLAGTELKINAPSEGVWFLIGADGSHTQMIAGSIVKQLDPKYIPANLDFNLSDYYTKAEIDSILGNCDTILDEISALIGE